MSELNCAEMSNKNNVNHYASKHFIYWWKGLVVTSVDMSSVVRLVSRGVKRTKMHPPLKRTWRTFIVIYCGGPISRFLLMQIVESIVQVFAQSSITCWFIPNDKKGHTRGTSFRNMYFKFNGK